MSDSAQRPEHEESVAERDLSAVADASPAEAVATDAGSQPRDVAGAAEAGVAGGPVAGEGPAAGEGAAGVSSAAGRAADADVADEGATEEAGDEQQSGSRRAGRVKQLEREGEVAADFLETLLDIADLDGDLDVDVEGDRAIVAIVDSDEGRVPRRLVGADGKVLEALQELTRLAVQVETGERSRLMLDIAGHRAARRAALVDLAHEAIASVKESGRRRELEPMSAFERKVVHDEVAAAGLVSESEGVEPNRYIVILPN